MTHAPPSSEILARLDRLPRKAAQPFRHLIATGQLSDAVLTTVLDAGELSGETNRLIAFTAAYFSMRLANVPVHDVIAMAKTHQRRINLAWSPARWKDEHDKLSRVAALKRLTEDSVTYDVSAYVRHLPPYFPGYVIATSRKLGMEGLRQRHCVAAYHDKLQAGTSAILAVFLDRRRWTVELQLTGRTDLPLRIHQIRTRHNVIADHPVRETIHALLGIPLPPKASATGAFGVKPYHYMANLRAVLPLLRQHGITSATVSFDGSGDEGSIEEVQLTPDSNAAAILRQTVTIQQREGVFDDGHWTYTSRPSQCSLADAFTAITDDYLEFTDVDWYNGSGGFGDLEIDVEAGTVSMHVSTRYEESETAFDADRDIASGDEI